MRVQTKKQGSGKAEERSFRDYFSAQAKEYATHRPTYPQALFDYLATLAPALRRAWDCGTGNGQAALKLAEHFVEVIATDASAEQIENAFAHERVHYRVEPAEKSSIESGTVDVVTVGTAVHWFDFDAFYEEVQRVGKAGAVLAVWTYHLPAVSPAVDEVLERYYREVLDGYWPERFDYLRQRYRTLPFPFAEVPSPNFPMEAQWSMHEMVGFMASWSATRRYAEEEGQHPLEIVLDDLREAWGQEDEKRKVQWTLYTRIGRLRR